MKHFINYFLTEKSKKHKELSALVRVNAIKNKDNNIDLIDDTARVSIVLDSDTDYTKTRFTQSEFLKRVFDALINNKKFKEKAGNDVLPYAITIEKIEQNRQKPGLSTNEISELIGKRSKERESSRTYPSLINLTKKGRMYFLDTEKYFNDNTDITVYQSANNGKKQKAEYDELVKAAEQEEAENDTQDTEQTTDTQNTEQAADTSDTTEQPTDTKDTEQTTDTKNDTETKKPTDDTKYTVTFIAAINEVITESNDVIVANKPFEQKLTFTLPVTASNTDYSKSMYTQIVKYIVTTYLNNIDNTVMPLTIIVDDIVYDMPNDAKDSISKYFYNETIVFNSDIKDQNKLVFNENTCMLITTTEGEEYYNDKVNAAEQHNTADEEDADFDDNSADLGKNNQEERTAAANSTMNKMRNKAGTKTPDTTTTDNGNLMSKLKSKSNSSNYTEKDAELAYKILTSLGVSDDKAKQVINKFISNKE
jgi:hypothetical protein